jgi:hypothetical protein
MGSIDRLNGLHVSLSGRISFLFEDSFPSHVHANNSCLARCLARKEKCTNKYYLAYLDINFLTKSIRTTKPI